MPIKLTDKTKFGEVCRNFVGRYKGRYTIDVIETILPYKEALQRNMKSEWYYSIKDNKEKYIMVNSSRDGIKFATKEECLQAAIDYLDETTK